MNSKNTTGISADMTKQSATKENKNPFTFLKGVPSKSDKNKPVTLDNANKKEKDTKETIDSIRISNIDRTNKNVDTYGYFPIDTYKEFTTESNGNRFLNQYIGERLVEGNNVFIKSTQIVVSNHTLDHQVSYELYTIHNNHDILKVGFIDTAGEVSWSRLSEPVLMGQMQIGKDYDFHLDQHSLLEIIPKWFADLEISGTKFNRCLAVDEVRFINFNSKKTPILFKRTYYCKGIGSVLTVMNQTNGHDLNTITKNDNSVEYFIGMGIQGNQ
ncbi:hypothetical protein LSG31_09190 [Fodinisporobacter ferrooxydans]|uniref:Uncharacterized protein n=1 Tax=Fodinisporobacter ferrooxydans TaxID=2901836 RepID=A0ABY4CQS4_9BACL|nr:hypothetical protein LSG31_09190 [Alicyclobacillaceae bacterium MYW30-H2]